MISIGMSIVAVANDGGTAGIPVTDGVGVGVGVAVAVGLGDAVGSSGVGSGVGVVGGGAGSSVAGSSSVGVGDGVVVSSTGSGLGVASAAEAHAGADPAAPAANRRRTPTTVFARVRRPGIPAARIGDVMSATASGARAHVNIPRG
jgi:hypothetical protein